MGGTGARFEGGGQGGRWREVGRMGAAWARLSLFVGETVVRARGDLPRWAVAGGSWRRDETPAVDRQWVPGDSL